MNQAAERTTQEERTRLMRLRLLEATVDCLSDHGWVGTTTTEVSRRAGVSRGAQLHHFPNKLELVMAAVRHLGAKRRDDLDQNLLALGSERRVREVLELLSAHFTGPVFMAALELWVAARTDPELRPHVTEFEREVGRETHELAVELLGVDESRGRNRALVQATLDLLRGLGLATTLSDDTQRRAVILDAWAETLEHELEKQ